MRLEGSSTVCDVLNDVEDENSSTKVFSSKGNTFDAARYLFALLHAAKPSRARAAVRTLATLHRGANIV